MVQKHFCFVFTLICIQMLLFRTTFLRSSSLFPLEVPEQFVRPMATAQKYLYVLPHKVHEQVHCSELSQFFCLHVSGISLTVVVKQMPSIFNLYPHNEMTEVAAGPLYMFC